MRAFLIIFSLLVLSVAAMGAFLYHDFRASGPLEAEKTVFIPRGTGFRGTVELLGNEGVEDLDGGV